MLKRLVVGVFGHTHILAYLIDKASNLATLQRSITVDIYGAEESIADVMESFIVLQKHVQCL